MAQLSAKPYLCIVKKRSRHIFWLAGVAASLILICQWYWVYYNYRTAKANFVATANYALRQSIDRYQLAQNKLPTSLEYLKPSLTFMVRTLPNQDPLALDTPGSKRRFSAEFSTVAIDQLHLPELRALVARLLSQQQHRPLHLDMLARIFRQELLKNNIREEFRLTMEHGAAPANGGINTPVNFYKDPVLVRAELVHPVRFLLRQNAGAAGVSTLLIVLSACSIFYMGRVIRRQEKLDDLKTSFINNISHELKTPLSILRTANEALSSFGAADDPESLQRYLSINAGVIDSMDSNIDRLLELNRDSRLQPQWQAIDLPALLENLIGRLAADDQPPVRMDIPQGMAEVFSDPYMLEVILLNLLDNALKYAGPEAQIIVRVKQQGQSWQLVVSDDGPGIAAAYLPYIFDRFYRVPTGNLHEVPGYGIGLAHVKDLVTALIGRISVKSTFGRGTEFVINFDLRWRG